MQHWTSGGTISEWKEPTLTGLQKQARFRPAGGPALSGNSCCTVDNPTVFLHKTHSDELLQVKRGQCSTASGRSTRTGNSTPAQSECLRCRQTFPLSCRCCWKSFQWLDGFWFWIPHCLRPPQHATKALVEARRVLPPSVLTC